MSIATSIFFNHSNFRLHACRVQWNGSTTLGLEASGAEDGANYESKDRESTVYQVESLWLQFD
jgi:hypothetical protein